ncbi:MAG TPA: proline/glycine betaine ABC transporter permease ProW, partial [Ramlibacter sp.]|nr:proline/glycine betaine ABC transporter permease ProW [Ramlibacter sp.]
MNDIPETTLEEALAASAAPSPAASAPSAPDAALQASDPWAEAGADLSGPAAEADTASAWDAPADTGNADWLAAPPQTADALPDPTGFQLHQLWDGSLPLDQWIDQGLQWAVDHFRPAFQAVRGPIDGTLSGVTGLLQGLPPG